MCRSSVGKKHGDAAGQNRQRQQEQEYGDEDGPYEQWHLVQRHAGSAHVENGGDEIDRSENRRSTGEMDRQDGIIHGGAGLARGGERWIKRPAATCAKGPCRAFRKHGDQKQAEGRGQQPEGNVVHARKRHVRRADHQRHEPVAETANHAGMTMKKIMSRPWPVTNTLYMCLPWSSAASADRAISHFGQAGKNLDAGLGQFNAHHDG